MVAGNQNPINWTKTVTISSTCHAGLSRQNRSHQMAKDGIQGSIEVTFATMDIVPPVKVWDNGRKWCEMADCRGTNSIVGVSADSGNPKINLLQELIQFSKLRERSGSRQDLMVQRKRGMASMGASQDPKPSVQTCLIGA